MSSTINILANRMTHSIINYSARWVVYAFQQGLLVETRKLLSTQSSSSESFCFKYDVGFLIEFQLTKNMFFIITDINNRPCIGLGLHDQ